MRANAPANLKQIVVTAQVFRACSSCGGPHANGAPTCPTCGADMVIERPVVASWHRNPLIRLYRRYVLGHGSATAAMVGGTPDV